MPASSSKPRASLGRVLDDLAGCPATVGRAGIEAGLVDPGERREEGGVTGLVTGDELGPAGCVHQMAWRAMASGWLRRAIASISTRPPFGSAATWTVERAGGGSGMNRP